MKKFWWILIFCLSVYIILPVGFITYAILSVKLDKTVYCWEFNQEISQINNLYIVDATNSEDYYIIKEISLDKSLEFIEDITSLEYKKYGWNLHTINGLCFVVMFKNGEYDIISDHEPMHVTWQEPNKHFSTAYLIRIRNM